jgi:hypothetical protein
MHQINAQLCTLSSEQIYQALAHVIDRLLLFGHFFMLLHAALNEIHHLDGFFCRRKRRRRDENNNICCFGLKATKFCGAVDLIPSLSILAVICVTRNAATCCELICRLAGRRKKDREQISSSSSHKSRILASLYSPLARIMPARNSFIRARSLARAQS